MSRSLFERKGPQRSVLAALGKSGLAWQVALGAESGPIETSDFSAGFARLAVLQQRMPVRWVCGIEQMPQWLQIVPDGVRSLGELRAAASANARYRLGTLPGGATWIADGYWSANAPFICRAMSSDLLEHLGARPSVTSVLEAGLQLMDRSACARDSAGAWRCVSSAHEAHLLHYSGKQCQHLRSFRLRQEPQGGEIGRVVQAEWRKERVRSNLLGDSLEWIHLGTLEEASVPDGLQWVDAQLQSHLSLIPRPGTDGDAVHLLNVFNAVTTWSSP
ncbi:hypothetical protein QYQ99_23210 [Comamonas testosteroni]|uniref:hypothetical protein n=1 Tax=Comamonas testosteroni TaxID=285 RepID=UPI00265EB99C|nr:hypothetical protein [Comamonas testosteroni]WKL15226.1 hypothetical protein QYQ99_23210 [Comamonas testosteroni]